MRRVVFTAEAEAQLDAKLAYLAEQGATTAAARLAERVLDFLTLTLADYPATGKTVTRRGLRESWIPGTSLVVWYTFDDKTMTIVTVWHTYQDRFGP
ncbi:MAG: type II toxin-antitoxin system RelE/ParE family toxin [Hyphomicrobium aestuarii]|nr:type II toxin-antitoxin system RelE/ParE family toxin [Hyphomicrobium aestuarii]